MSKKDEKVSEAQLPPPPLVTEFIKTVKEWKDKKQDAPARSKMFEDESDHDQHVGKPINTKGTEAVAVNVAMDFHSVSEANNQENKNLDNWFVGFVKITVDVHAMHVDKTKQYKYLEIQKKMCGDSFKVRSLSTSTIKTYINALSGIYNALRQEHPFVPSSKMRFPEFNMHFSHVDKQYKVIEAIEEAQSPEPEILRDDELQKLWADTNFDSLFETQRYNILIFGNRLGFRADTLEHLLTTRFEQGSDAQGKYLVPKIGTMKNRQGGFHDADRDLFEQEIRPCLEDKRFCAIAVYERQCALPRESTAASEDYLFRSMKRVIGKVLLKKPTAPATYRGVANWVFDVVGRKLSFKSIARRVVVAPIVAIHRAAGP